MKKLISLSICGLAVVLIAQAASAAEFYPISSVTSSTAATDLFLAANLIEGPGVGFESDEPHNRLGSTWVTDAPGGFPSDYIAVAGMPVISLDLGEDRPLSEISVWGYASTNANGVSEFGLNFATDAEGPGGGSSSAGPFFPTNDDVVRQSFAFSPVVARYVELIATDNFFVAPGDGSGGETPGGDRVGLGEIAFAIPEPSSLIMLVSALAAMLGFRRR